MCENRGLPFSETHGLLEQYHRDDLPCKPCEASRQWEDIPRDEDDTPSHDVVHATHNFGRVPTLIQNSNVVIDELPDFTLDLTSNDLRQSVTSCLNEIDAPAKTWEELVHNHGEDYQNRFFQQEFERPDREWFLQNTDAHALAHGIIKAILRAKKQCHNRWKGEILYRYPDLNPHTEAPEHRVRIRAVFDGDNEIKLLQAVPDFSEARCVIGLDAFPTEPKWRANTLPALNFERVLTKEEEKLWRQHERNLEIVQVGDNKNTWTQQGFNHNKVFGLCAELRHRFGADFSSGITSKKFKTDLREGMEAAGINDPLMTHYGMEKSINTFGNEEAGLVAGCISPSSEQIKDWLALLEKQATPKREVSDEYTGQEWTGPDASIAKELLADVREKHVLQSVGRYARSPADSEDSAVVHVLTNVLPEHWVDRRVDDVDVLGEKQREIVDVLCESDGITPADVSEKVEASRRHVYDTLEQLHDAPWCEVDDTEGKNTGDKYSATRSPDCVVEL